MNDFLEMHVIYKLGYHNNGTLFFFISFWRKITGVFLCAQCVFCICYLRGLKLLSLQLKVIIHVFIDKYSKKRCTSLNK